MANMLSIEQINDKLTIEQINARLDELHRRLSRMVKAIDKLRALRKRIRSGKVPGGTSPC